MPLPCSSTRSLYSEAECGGIGFVYRKGTGPPTFGLAIFLSAGCFWLLLLVAASCHFMNSSPSCIHSLGHSANVAEQNGHMIVFHLNLGSFH